MYAIRSYYGFGIQSNIDQIGFWGTVGVAAGFAAHSLVQLGRSRLGKGEAGTAAAGGEQA